MQDRQQLKQSLENIKSPRILVIGDLMLDRYSWGSVDRISPEAPIPILRVEREDQRLGGAANTISNLSALGAKVWACGLIGEDESGKAVNEMLLELNVDCQGLFYAKDFTTILKHRMIAGHNHLLRMDFDPPSHWTFHEQQSILDFLQATIPTIDLIVVSDYGKGLLVPEILETLAELGQENNISILTDPYPGRDFQDYQGFTLLKPNRKETERTVGFALDSQKSILNAASVLKSKVQLEYVVISLDKDGLLLFHDEEQYHFFETNAPEVFDVVGAGDMVISVMAYMMAGKAPIEYAAYWANLAAGMEIMHVGVVPFTKEALLHRFEYGQASSKIVTLEQLLRDLQSISVPIVFTNGYFDNLSAGHLKFLQQLEQLNGFKIVAINSDRSIEKQKGQRPLLNEHERATLLSSIETIDRVIIFDTADTKKLLLQIHPNIVVKGESFQNQKIREQATIDQIGAKLEFLLEYETNRDQP